IKLREPSQMRRPGAKYMDGQAERWLSHLVRHPLLLPKEMSGVYPVLTSAPNSTPHPHAVL
ncbi:MAG TPA: hypothetical protein VG145_06450, partial [Xanthobacteraceae bacterium]|nr:hypothetical protein [Xanthobacteraceae bacterium]